MLSLYFERQDNNFFDVILKNLEKHKECKFIVIIPEQYSFYMEKKFYNILKNINVNIEIFSFKRLCFNIFKKYGHFAGEYALKHHKILITHLCILNLENRFKQYKILTKNTDITKIILKTIENVKQNNIDIDFLKYNIKNINDSNLKYKLNIFCEIFNKYCGILNKRFKDPSQDIEKANEISLMEHFFEGKSIYFYKFSRLKGAQLKFVETMLKQADVNFFIDYEEKEPLFKMHEDTILKLENLAISNNIKIRRKKFLEKESKKSYSIYCMQQSLFRVNKKKIYKTKNINNLKIIYAENKYIEIETMSSYILKLLKKGIELDDIAIIVSNLNEYKALIKTTLHNFNIPYFIDDISVAKDMEIIRICQNILEMCTEFDIKICLNILKSKITKFTAEEVAIFENYLYVNNINSTSINFTFKNFPRNNNLNDINKIDIEIAEKIRSTIISVIKTMQVAGNSTKNIITNLIKSIEILEIKNNIENKFKEKKEYEFYEMQWNTLIKIFEAIFKLTHKTKISKKHFKCIFKMVSENFEIDKIPKYLNSVFIGTAEKVIPLNLKALLILGASPDAFPYKHLNSNEFFTNDELLKLEKLNIKFSNTLQEKNLIETFNLYKALTSPSRYAFIFSSNFNESYNKKSELISSLTDMFGEDIIETVSRNVIMPSCLTKKVAIKKLYINYKINNNEVDALKEYFKLKVKSLENTKQKIKFNLNKKILKNRITASQIEQFYICPFSYFCRYILKITPYSKLELNGKTAGSITHKILENIISSRNFDNISNREIENNLSVITNKYFYGSDKNLNFKQDYNFLKENIKILYSAIKKELEISKFKPIKFEYKISSNSKIKPVEIKIDSHNSIFVEGIIDRIDIKNLDGKTYIRIIDYKTQKKSLDFCELFKGLNLQIIIYILAIAKSKYIAKKNICISGMLYMPTVGNLKSYRILNKECAENELEEYIQKGFTANGIIINSLENSAILNQIKDENYKNFIAIKTLKNNSFSKNCLEKMLISNEELEQLFKFAEKKIRNIYYNVSSMHFENKPINIHKNNTIFCEYCEFKEICNNEKIIKSTRNKTITKKEFFDVINN